MNTVQLQAILASYLRTFAAVAAFAISQGETDVKKILLGAVCAVLGPLARAVNPKDGSFGVGASK